ncbi:hypothetical protein H312_03452 [Anncaliia algerae PRA339]|uniref:ISXO2-like transposase domain-containing protein n=1 Tax=Anncaliia algerae PRA339 TaxID=1288291 RepID=A0A059EWC3_9MICR|nr:hypothetical protein H312_03452 [Anncaliia algerae PRA339]
MPGSIVHTDEHASYKKLCKLGHNHGSVCHKFKFVNKETIFHTQFVESFHNCLKLEIKKRKMIYTSKRFDFLAEFIWKFNHKNDRFQSLLNLIKLS